MPRNLAKAVAFLIASVLAGAVGIYALLVVGSRRGIEYYYGR